MKPIGYKGCTWGSDLTSKSLSYYSSSRNGNPSYFLLEINLFVCPRNCVDRRISQFFIFFLSIETTDRSSIVRRWKCQIRQGIYDWKLLGNKKRSWPLAWGYDNDEWEVAREQKKKRRGESKSLFDGLFYFPIAATDQSKYTRGCRAQFKCLTSEGKAKRHDAGAMYRWHIN